MKPFRALAALSAATLLLGIGSVWAQPANAPKKRERIEPAAPIADATWRAIRLKNVQPSLMAYWIDPVHNAFPSRYGNPPESLAPFPKSDATTEKGMFDLPASVARLVPADAQNLLFIEGGNADAVRQLQENVTLLDQPLRHIEIEAQLVEINPEDLSAFGMDAANEKSDANEVQPFLMRGSFQAQFNSLVADGRIKIITAPRATITNNLDATLVGSLNFRTKFYYDVTPTINGDDTITLFSKASIEPAQGKSLGLASIVNIRDGDTFALSIQSLSSSKLEKNLAFIFVTARILRQDKTNTENAK